MSIRKKILGLVIMAVLGVGVLLAQGWWTIRQVNQASKGVVDDQLMPLLNVEMPAVMRDSDMIALLLNADRDSYQATLGEKNAIMAANAKEHEQAVKDSVSNRKQVVDRVGQAAAQADSPEIQKLYAEFQQLNRAWNDAHEAVLAQTGKPGAAAESLYAQSMAAHEKFEAMRDAIDQMVGVLEARIAESNKRVPEQIQQAQDSSDAMFSYAQAAGAMFLAVAVVMIAVVTAAGFWLSRSILRPLAVFGARMRDISTGERDLTRRIDESGSDEFADLARGFNAFVQGIQQLLTEVAGATREVSAAATQIAATSDEMAHGVDEQATQVAQIQAAVEEMSTSLASVAEKSVTANTSAKDAGDQAREGGNVVSQTVTDIHSISDTVRNAAQVVEQLGQRSEQIGAVIGVINDIDDQTNLLALNAAIEAARAGEHGRGFSVVADEVRKLADRTTRATDEIATSIKAIQNETREAVGRMNSGTEQVTASVERAARAGENLDKIVSAAEQVRNMIGSIAAATEQQSTTSEQVARAAQSMSLTSRQSQEGTRQAADAANQLSNRAEHLQRLVGQFKLS